MKRTFSITSVLLSLCFAVFLSTSAYAVSFTLENITDNSVYDGTGLTVEVVDNHDGTVSFIFYNDTDNGGMGSITDVYFDYGSFILSYNTLAYSSGVDYGVGANPSNLPGGNTIGFDSDFSADSDSPHLSANGVNDDDEWLTIVLNYSGDFDDLTTAISNGDFMIGIHVQAIGVDDESDSLVTSNPVPEPATMLLLGTGLMGIAAFGRKKLFMKK